MNHDDLKEQSKEQLSALLQSYKECPSRGVKDEITIARIEDILENCEITFLRHEDLQ